MEDSLMMWSCFIVRRRRILTLSSMLRNYVLYGIISSKP